MSMAALGALLQLSSPALPVGAYSYSQGLEAAVEAGMVREEASALRWISDALSCVLARYEAPLWLRLHSAHLSRDRAALQAWNDDFLATRETAELRAETVQMGYSLVQLMRGLNMATDLLPAAGSSVTFPTAHAGACAAWGIDAEAGLYAYLYAWAENQVTAAIKCVPLGQTAGQRLLLALRASVARAVQLAFELDDDALSTQTPMLAILGSRHETQYSRLFRS